MHRALHFLSSSFFLFHLTCLAALAQVATDAPAPRDSIQQVSLIFFVQHGQPNTLDVYSHPFFKGKEANYAFETPGADLPEGMQFTDTGLLSWSPAAEQFTRLQADALRIPFAAVDNRGILNVAGNIRVVAQGELDPTAQAGTAPLSAVTVASQLDTASEPNGPLRLLAPETAMWNEKAENETFSFQFDAGGGMGEYTFEVLEPEMLMEQLDRYGNFEWTPGYDAVSAEEQEKTFHLSVRLRDGAGNDTTRTFRLYVRHQNRPPVVSELPTFYIQYEKNNKYALQKSGLIYDPDGDSIIFKTALKELPQGMRMGPDGVITWKPSVRQFNYLRNEPIYLSFSVEEVYGDARSIGQLKIDASQEDLPPVVTMIPEKSNYELKENEELHINFFVTDPNGESDLLAFDFVSENSALDKKALDRIDDWQFEFTWSPGYDFIKQEGASEEFVITFFAIDKENNRTEIDVKVKVSDTENLVEKDRVLYDQYRTVLERSWDLIHQLNEKEDELEKRYKKARTGKKNRAIFTASMGGLTGLSPVIFLNEPTGQKVTAGIGGTATATIGTLEASEVIGESPTEIMRDLSYVSQKRNDLIVNGNVFASKYALPLSRRDKSFSNDLHSMSLHLRLNDIAKLELDPAWENSKNATDKNIKKIFKDFNPDPRFEQNYE
jgi:hypothetical protein